MIMVNCGGSCVEFEDGKRDGKLVMEETLRAMSEVFVGDGRLWVLDLGLKEEDSCVALTRRRPDSDEWKGKMVKGLRGFVDMWRAYQVAWIARCS
ncbi:uncharacterized protein A4U43_C07F35610 [Asparagus officinalis]|uniref:Uncharacterized protein n=1 Tax=Asparagus officinalis TaxID=4686 RepID=A0A5P1EML9_ASPOF|nr:uncharacterized protein A4U43_C07F35610 [Asparagus officinalis]